MKTYLVAGEGYILSVFMHAFKVPEFCVLDEDCAGCQPAEDDAMKSVEKAMAQDVHFEEPEGRPQEDIGGPKLSPFGESLLGAARGKAVERPHVVAEGLVAIVEHDLVDCADLSVDDHACVDASVVVAAFRSPKQSYVVVSVPSAVFYEASEKISEPFDGVAIQTVFVFDDRLDSLAERIEQAFVGVENQGPLGLDLWNGPVQLIA